MSPDCLLMLPWDYRKMWPSDCACAAVLRSCSTGAPNTKGRVVCAGWEGGEAYKFCIGKEGTVGRYGFLSSSSPIPSHSVVAHQLGGFGCPRHGSPHPHLSFPQLSLW